MTQTQHRTGRWQHRTWSMISWHKKQMASEHRRLGTMCKRPNHALITRWKGGIGPEQVTGSRECHRIRHGLTNTYKSTESIYQVTWLGGHAPLFHYDWSVSKLRILKDSGWATVHSRQSPWACQLESMYCNLCGHPFGWGGSNLYNVDFNSCELLNIFKMLTFLLCSCYSLLDILLCNTGSSFQLPQRWLPRIERLPCRISGIY